MSFFEPAEDSTSLRISGVGCGIAQPQPQLVAAAFEYLMASMASIMVVAVMEGDSNSRQSQVRAFPLATRHDGGSRI